MSFETTYNLYREAVEEELLRLKNSYQSNPRLADALSYMIGLGGKRLRPVMTLAACDAFAGKYDVALKPAVGLEVFHNFSLIHDDIMDNAPLRRGKPTVHEKWGVNMGILSGDLLLIKSYELINAVPSTILPHVFRIFNHTAIQLCEGQQYDMDFGERESVTEEEYLRMILFKTAVLLAASMQIGALAGGASEEDADHLYEFGCEIGIAFQIKDDWLDTFGDPSKVGKRVGGDIIEGKKTLLMIKALALGNADQQLMIRKVYMNGATDEQRVEGVLQVFDELRIRELCREEIRKHYELALQHLAKVSLPDEKKIFFSEFARFLIERDF